MFTSEIHLFSHIYFLDDSFSCHLSLNKRFHDYLYIQIFHMVPLRIFICDSTTNLISLITFKSINSFLHSLHSHVGHVAPFVRRYSHDLSCMCTFQGLVTMWWNAPSCLSHNLLFLPYSHRKYLWFYSVRKGYCSCRLYESDVFFLGTNILSQLRRAAIERPLQAQAEHGNRWGLNLQGF